MRRKREVTSQQTKTLKKNKVKSQKKPQKPEQSTISNYKSNQIIHQLIFKFQDTVSIRASNPSITKYLLNTKSEGNVEWLC